MSGKIFNDDFKFDIDLGFGQEMESRLQRVLANKGLLEIKTERDRWKQTGNFAIEVAFKGNPSGLSKTQADFWLHAFYDSDTDEICFSFLLPVSKLKKIIERMLELNQIKTVHGGDRMDSKLLLVPIHDFTKHLHPSVRTIIAD
tara:strand:+ start:1310 stop:1741 length:432 start_codon:yes stop_codon:yes gene_type:complete